MHPAASLYTVEPVALVHHPAAVSMFDAGFALICEKV